MKRIKKKYDNLGNRKALFGCGYIVSDKVAQEVATATAKATATVIEWELSEKEKLIIKELNNE